MNDLSTIMILPQYDIKPCTECVHCRHTDMFKDYVDKDGVSHFMAFCNPTRSIITEKTKSWLCNNKMYERK